jgi:2'-5' RNA ligase
MTTIGVAIAVPEPWGGRLQDYRTDLGDATAAGIPTHITLMPPFEVADPDMPAVEQHLAEASAMNTAFRVHLRGTGTFRPVSPVVFVTVVEGISGCEQLALSVRRGPLATELQFPYHPHVTVAHHLEEHDLDRAQSTLRGYAADFTVSSIGLYEHGADSVWRLAHRFPFLGGKAQADGNGANGTGGSDGSGGAPDGRRP